MYPAFCRSADLDADASHIFLQGVLAALALVEVGLGMQSLEREQGGRAAPVCSATVSAVLRVGSHPKLLE